MNKLQTDILRALAEDSEMCYFSRFLQTKTGATRNLLKLELGILRKAGYIELVRGLISDDGPGYRGSGYRILPIGERFLKDS